MKQVDHNDIFSENFLDKTFQEKRSILHEFLLDSYPIKTNIEVLCFEDKQIDSEGSGSRWFLNGNDTSQKLKSITSNKFYKILEVKDVEYRDILIKIEGDTGRKTWVQANRFLVAESVKQRLRQEKLKRLEDLNNG